MRWYTRVILTSLCCVGIAMALSFLPDMEWLQGGEIGVFNNVAAIQLSDDNLVDQLIELPLNLKLRRVDWAQSMLSVDLELPPEIRDRTVIYEDLYALSFMGLTETRNVKRMLIRVMLQGDAQGSNRLLLAMDADRERWRPIRPGDWKHKELEQILSEMVHITFTKQWSEMIWQNDGSNDLAAIR